MKTATKWGIAAGTAAVVGAGTAATVCLIKHKDSHRTKHDIMQDIVEKLNSMPNATTIITEELLENKIKELIQNTGNDIDSMQQAIVDIVHKKIKDANDVTQANIDSSITTVKELFKNEIKKHENVLNDQMDQLANGIVGDHDLNYYKDILDESVTSSQFDELYNSMDSLDADLNERIDNLIKDLNKDKSELAEVKTSISDLTNSTTGALANVEATIDALKTSLTAAIASAEGSAAGSLENLKKDVEANADEIKRLLTNTSANNDGIDSLAFLLNETIDKVNGNALTIEDIQIANSLIKESNGELAGKVEELTISMVKIEALARNHATDVAAIKAAAANFQTNLDTMNQEVKSLSGKFEGLKARIGKNEKDIQTLFTMIKNTDSTINDHINKTLAYMMDTNKTLGDLQLSVDIATNTFEKRILVSENNIDGITAELTNVKADVVNISHNVTEARDQIAAFDKGIKKINSNIAEIFQDMDDLTRVVDANEAKVMGLEERVALLEQNGSGTGAAEIIYETSSKKLRNLVSTFHFTKDITKYKQIQILYKDAHTDRFGSMVFNIDQQKEVDIYAGGDRLYPNRSWYAIQFDYRKNTMKTAFYYAAGHASWQWHYNKKAISVKQIVGIL